MSSPAVDSYLDELLADLPAMTPGEQAAAAQADATAEATPPVEAEIAAEPAPAPAPASGSVSAPISAPARAQPKVSSAAATPVRGFQAEPPEASHRPAAPPTQRWLRVALGRDHYAFELLRVQEVVRMAPIVAMRGADHAVLGVMNLRGRIVPVFDLGRWLGGADVQIGERARIVVVERDDELIGVLVADVEDVASLGREHIEPPLPGRAGALADVIVGIARVGQVPTVLLDANALFE